MLSVGEAILFSLLLGAFLGLLYSTSRYLCMLLGAGVPSFSENLPKSVKLPLLGERSVLPKESRFRKGYRNVLYFLIDVLYFFFCGTALSVFVYSVGGIFRFSYVTGAIIGFVLFSLTVGRLLSSVSVWILFFIRVLFSYCFYVVSFPFLLLFRIFSAAFLKLRLLFLRLCDKIKIEVYDRKEKNSGFAFGKEWEDTVREKALPRMFPYKDV